MSRRAQRRARARLAARIRSYEQLIRELHATGKGHKAKGYHRPGSTSGRK